MELIKKVYNLEGNEQGEIRLEKEIFEVPFSHDLVYQVTTALLSNKRRPTAHTKVRGEIRGGGIKPWKQKGTGRARTGSIRNPLFRGGGTIFGPRNTANYQRKVNKKARKKAFEMVFSEKIKDNEVFFIDSFILEKPVTKKMMVLFSKLKTKGKSALIVSSSKNKELQLSLRNIKKTAYRSCGNVSVLDLLNHQFFFLEKEAVDYYRTRSEKPLNAADSKKVEKKAKTKDEAKVKTKAEDKFKTKAVKIKKTE
jgi:large subunit ribosomal protein L4